MTTQILSTDILMGRGAGIHRHEGNIRFRRLVATRKIEYLRATRTHKQAIAMAVVEEILQCKGRFLCKVESTNESKHADSQAERQEWVLADQFAILEKVKHALRYKEPSNSPSKTSNCVPKESKTSNRVPKNTEVSKGTKVARTEPSGADASPTVSGNGSCTGQQHGQQMYDQSLQALLFRHELERDLLNQRYLIARDQVDRFPSVNLIPQVSIPASTAHHTQGWNHGSVFEPLVTCQIFGANAAFVLGQP